MEIHMSHNLSGKHVARLIFAIMALFPLVGMGVDLISPSLPAISESLHVSAIFSKNLISIYLLGYALGNFFIGFLSDAWGRRNLILIGFLGFTLASLLPALIASPDLLLCARFLQGLCIASFGVISRGIISDIVHSDKIVRTGAATAMMWGLGPIIGPLIGGYLQAYFGWQACFYFFALFGFIGLMMLFFILPETLLNRKPLSLTQIKTNLRMILSNSSFVGLVIAMGATYALLIAFNTLGPFLVQSVLHYSPIFFGHVALCMGVAFLVGTIFCRHLLKKLTPEKLLKIVSSISMAFILLVLPITYFMPLNLSLLLFTTGWMFFTCGLIYPAGIGKILSLFRSMASSAGAITNLIINVMFTGMTAIILSFVHVETIIPIICSYVILMAICTLANRSTKKQQV
ncbi:MAG: Bcr/CflA family efflux MFS transporter [Gammaproteobacteria bacterium]|nr:Bcr/CflA family efflux MFS transporter [Gammaproteobacteria bacterium]